MIAYKYGLTSQTKSGTEAYAFRSRFLFMTLVSFARKMCETKNARFYTWTK